MKTIYIYTTNGLLEAEASPLENGNMIIRAKNEKLSMVVNKPTYDRKMQDDKPTFYSC